MILFKSQHAKLILSGQKTQTRRLGRKRWNVGSVRKCYIRPPFARPPGAPFASVRILRVWQERLNEISHEDALAEGYPDRTTYWGAFCQIHGLTSSEDIESALTATVWCIEYELVEATRDEAALKGKS